LARDVTSADPRRCLVTLELERDEPAREPDDR
jgi:hypothetical protein